MFTDSRWQKNPTGSMKLIASSMVTCLIAASAFGGVFESSGVDKVKAGVLLIDQTRTLGEAIELSGVFSDTKWSSFTDEKGRDIVQFEGVIKNFGEAAERVCLPFLTPYDPPPSLDCKDCTYYLQFAFLKSPDAEGQFKLLRSWFEADVAKTSGGKTSPPERILAPELTETHTSAPLLQLLSPFGIEAPSLSHVYAGNTPELVATAFTCISAALNDPSGPRHYVVMSDESYQTKLREKRAKEQSTKRSSATTAPRVPKFLQQTPLGRYTQQVNDAIGSSWYHTTGPRMDSFSYGTISVAFAIGHDGKVSRHRIVSNTSNESLEVATVESLLAADIPPMPPELSSALGERDLERELTFSVVPDGNGRRAGSTASPANAEKQNTR